MTWLLAIDNGTTGSCTVLGPGGHAVMTATPTKEAVMGKAGKIIRRVDVPELTKWIKNAAPRIDCAYLEKPFTGSAMMINSTVLAARAFEATIICLEDLAIGYEVVSSRDWQAAMLPGVTGRANLKRASYAKGVQMYPALKPYIHAIGDADSLLMAHHFYNNTL